MDYPREGTNGDFLLVSKQRLKTMPMFALEKQTRLERKQTRFILTLPVAGAVYFLSDPPHLLKTTRNAWNSKKRNLWVHVHMLYLYYTCTFCYSAKARKSHGLILLLYMRRIDLRLD